MSILISSYVNVFVNLISLKSQDAPLCVCGCLVLIPVHVGAQVAATRLLTLDWCELIQLGLCCLDVVVDHVNQDRAAEQALLLQQHVDVVQLVADSVPLLVGWLPAAATDHALDVHAVGLALAREELLDARDQGLVLVWVERDSRLAGLVGWSWLERLVVLDAAGEEIAHLDLVDFLVVGLELLYDYTNFGIACHIALEIGPDTLPVEGVAAWINEKLTVVKDRAKAYVTRLPRVDCDVFVPLTTFLSTQLLSVRRVLLDLHPEALDLPFVIIQARA